MNSHYYFISDRVWQAQRQLDKESGHVDTCADLGRPSYKRDPDDEVAGELGRVVEQPEEKRAA